MKFFFEDFYFILLYFIVDLKSEAKFSFFLIVRPRNNPNL